MKKFDKTKMQLRRHRDDDYWDSIHIEAQGAVVSASVIPRYKTSGLSGDEWRVTAQLLVKWKGSPRQPMADEVLRRNFHSMRGLTEHAAYFLWSEAQAMLELSRATMVVRRKGVVLMQHKFKTLGDAAMGMDWHIVTANEGHPEVAWHHLTDEEELAHCQQVGCAEPPKNFFKLNKILEGNELVSPKYDWTATHTWYCGRHSCRGDCGLEDADRNMSLVSGDGKTAPRRTDESPSVFGGTIIMGAKR